MRLYFGGGFHTIVMSEDVMRSFVISALILSAADVWAAKPLPEKPKLDAAKLVARDRYFKELKQADAAELKTFLDAADATTDDDARQAALYLVVADAAAESGNLRLAMESLDRLGKIFEYDVPLGKLKFLEAAAKTSKNAESRATLINRAVELIEEAIDAERFEVAESAARLGESLATKLRDARLRKELAARRSKIDAQRRENRTQADALTKAAETLKRNSQDPEANRLIGLQLAADEKWSEALAHLKQADDDELRAAAEAELLQPEVAEKQLALADLWWQSADSLENDQQRASLRARAVFWYSRSVSGLADMKRTRAERRRKLSGEETVAAASRQTSGDNKFTDVLLAPGASLRLMRIPASEDGKVKGFWLGRTEVTEGQWAAVMGGAAGSRDLPKVMISFNHCRVLIGKLNAAPIGRRLTFRLPTQEEFAHACGKPANLAGSLSDYAWLYESSPERVQPVARKKANLFGLHDMLGNVWEFADDGRFYGLSAWDNEKALPAAFISFDLPANYTGARSDYLGSNLGLRLAADLK